MYDRFSDGAPAGTNALKASGPLLALCCLGTVLFIIAATIVVALIPVYISRKDATLGGQSSNYYFQLTPNQRLGNDGSFGSTDQSTIADAISNQLGYDSGALQFSQLTAATSSTGGRRRRGFRSRHERQSSGTQRVYGIGSFFRKKCHKDVCVSKITNVFISVTLLYTNGTTTNFTVVINPTAISIPATQSSSTASTTITTTATTTGAFSG